LTIVSCSITTSSLGWRWVFWVSMLFAGSCTLLGLFFLPETFAPVLLTRKAKRLRKANPEKNKDLYKMLLVEPILLLATIYLSVAYGIIYASTFSCPLQSSHPGL